MNITRLNFAKTLPYIKNIIKQSHYVSIDLQMSGIISDMQTNPSLVDSIQQRYAKTKKRIQTFIPLQIGVCCHKIFFYYARILCYPFNFYIYPLSIKQSDSIKFSFHAASLNFLSKNDFDFNKLFYEYIPFISKQQILNVQGRKQQGQFMKQLMRLQSLNSPSTKAFLNMNLLIVEKWITQNTLPQIRISVQYIKFKSYKTLIDEIQRKYPSIAFEFLFDSQQIYRRTQLIIKKKQHNQNQNGFNFRKQDGQNQLPLINQIISCISQNKLPILVHNGFLDLMHIYLRFFQKLPNDWKTYCQKISSQFPKIYDTKFICNNYPVIFQTLDRKTNLQNCFNKLKENYQKKQSERDQLYKIQIDEDFKQYTLEHQSSHQAGFDALMTGYVFFRSMNILKKSLQSLKKQQFHTNPSLMRNRIPLGNLKVPLNLEEVNQQYALNGNIRFEVKPLLKNIVRTQNEIMEYFKQKQNAINFYWKDESKTSFYITFIDKKDEQSFCKEFLDKDKIGIVEFLNQKYLFVPLNLNQFT